MSLDLLNDLRIHVGIFQEGGSYGIEEEGFVVVMEKQMIELFQMFNETLDEKG